MPIVEHVDDWSKLAELLPQLGREYAKQAGLFRLLLTIVALLPPLMIPIEAAKWFTLNSTAFAGSLVFYVVLAWLMVLFVNRWASNVKSFGTERIDEEGILPKLLDRIERDAGKGGEMNFEELYLTDGSGLERRTRKHIIYAENDIEMTMDRGQKLFGNNNVPLQINTAIVLVFCLYIVVGAPFLAIDWPLWVQQAMLLLAPLAIYVIQNYCRQHLLNQVVTAELLTFVRGEEPAVSHAEEAGEEGIQARA